MTSYSDGQVLGSMGGAKLAPASGAADLFKSVARFDKGELRRSMEESDAKKRRVTRETADEETTKKKKPRKPKKELVVAGDEPPVAEEERPSTKTTKRKKAEVPEEKAEEKVAPTKEEDAESLLSAKEKEERTIFVGNLPLDTKVKQVKKYFSSRFGPVLSARLRSLPTGGAKVEEYDEKLVKKVSAYKKTFLENAKQTANAYVVFAEKFHAQKAKEADGGLWPETNRHIRVDLASGSQHDHLRTAFVGNVPRDTDEEALRRHFAEHLPGGLDAVEAVRVVRDKQTHLAIGVAYVLLKERNLVADALRLDGTNFKTKEGGNKRKLRVTTCGKRTKRSNNNSAPVSFSSPKKQKKKIIARGGGPAAFMNLNKKPDDNKKKRKKDSPNYMGRQATTPTNKKAKTNKK